MKNAWGFLVERHYAVLAPPPPPPLPPPGPFWERSVFAQAAIWFACLLSLIYYCFCYYFLFLSSVRTAFKRYRLPLAVKSTQVLDLAHQKEPVVLWCSWIQFAPFTSALALSFSLNKEFQNSVWALWQQVFIILYLCFDVCKCLSSNVQMCKKKHTHTHKKPKQEQNTPTHPHTQPSKDRDVWATTGWPQSST